MSQDKYYLLDTDYGSVDGMMLDRMPSLPKRRKDNWMAGQPFTQEPSEPIVVGIMEGEETSTLLPFFKNPPLASDEFIDALMEVGVDNLITYEAIITNLPSQTIKHVGYKAFNIIGLIKTAGSDTKFATESREIDASIEKFQTAPETIKGLYMFRLAESARTIVIHEKVKNHLESKNFIGLDFEELDGAFIL